MALFDEIANVVNQVGQTTVQKTKEITELSKINSLILAEENKVKNYHVQIGQKYIKHMTEDMETLFTEETKGVLESQEKIRNYKQQIKDIKGIQQCPNCTADVPKGVIFCSLCGTEVEKPEVVVEEQVVEGEPVVQHVEFRV